MDHTIALLIGLGLVALVAIAFFAVFRGKGKINVDSPLVKLRAEGENPPPPAAIPAGASVKGIKARGDVFTTSTSEGGVSAESVESDGTVTTSHTPGVPPPKA